MDLAAVTARQQSMWATGDFHKIGVAQPIVGERLVRSLGVRAGERVLDVAAGAGNTALAAARRWGIVTATDYVPDLLARARARADAEGLQLVTDVADAQALPFADGAYDVVTSTFGAMFAPDQEKAAREMVRVLVPEGGRLGMANWTPEGMVGELFALGARFVPPPPELPPASRWGTEQGLQELLGDLVGDLRCRVRTSEFVYPSAAFMLDHFRNWFGPTATQFAALDEAGQEAYAEELLALYQRHNDASDGTILIRSPYLEVVATTLSA
jgi:SAM-dependent methyltransferase